MSNLLSQVELAAKLGVDARAIAVWRQRAHKNGFPPPVGKEPRTWGPNSGTRQVNVWRWVDVKNWHAKYVPSKGGRPLASSSNT